LLAVDDRQEAVVRGSELRRIERFLQELAAYFDDLGEIELQLQVTVLQAWHWLQRAMKDRLQHFLTERWTWLREQVMCIMF
jgi:hypothetical protein